MRGVVRLLKMLLVGAKPPAPAAAHSETNAATAIRDRRGLVKRISRPPLLEMAPGPRPSICGASPRGAAVRRADGLLHDYLSAPALHAQQGARAGHSHSGARRLGAGGARCRPRLHADRPPAAPRHGRRGRHRGRRFYDHSGVDPAGFVRAIFANLRAGRFAQGGSTLDAAAGEESVPHERTESYRGRSRSLRWRCGWKCACPRTRSWNFI